MKKAALTVAVLLAVCLWSAVSFSQSAGPREVQLQKERATLEVCLEASVKKWANILADLEKTPNGKKHLADLHSLLKEIANEKGSLLSEFDKTERADPVWLETGKTYFDCCSGPRNKIDIIKALISGRDVVIAYPPKARVPGDIHENHGNNRIIVKPQVKSGYLVEITRYYPSGYQKMKGNRPEHIYTLSGNEFYPNQSLYQVVAWVRATIEDDFPNVK